MVTTNKSVVCSGCGKRFTVDFKKNETQKQVTHSCGKIQIVKPKISKK